jgi:alkanesulfonate monooxygenase SsuD/methylene tetrahydromethanopterin reductase-like flavin-dependent oxidoreductase (luciferase family)
MAMLEAMLDGRRFIPGVGRGVAPAGFASLRIPVEESRERFYEVLDIIRLADTQELFAYRGRHYQVPPTSIRPQPRRKGHLLDDVRGAFTTKGAVETASRKGLGQIFVAGEPVHEMAANCTMFNMARISAGLLPDQPIVVRVALCVGERAAGQDLELAYRRMMRDSKLHYAIWGSRGLRVVRDAGPDGPDEPEIVDPIDFREGRIAEQAAAQLIGTPDQIIEKAVAMQHAVSNDTLVLEFLPQGMSHDTAMKSLELFAREVLPVLQSLETPLHPHSAGSTEAQILAWPEHDHHTSPIADG